MVGALGPVKGMSVATISAVVPPVGALPLYKAALAKVSAGTGDVTLLALGDSLTQGVIADSGVSGPISTSYPARLAAKYVAAGIPAVIAGYAGCGNITTIAALAAAQPMLSFDTPGDWGFASGATGLGLGGYMLQTIATSKMHITPGYSFDTIEFYGANAGASAIGVYLDGATSPVTTINTTAAGTSFKQTISVPRGAQTVDIARLSGSRAYFGLILFRDTQTRRVRIVQGGFPGITAVNYVTAQTGAWNMIQRIAEIAPDLTLLQLGTNEESAFVTTPSTQTDYTTNMQTIIAKAALSGDIILAKPEPRNGSGTADYETVCRNLIDQLTSSNNLVTPIDITAVLGGSKAAAISSGWMTTSDIHLTASGYDQKATGWYGKISTS